MRKIDSAFIHVLCALIGLIGLICFGFSPIEGMAPLPGEFVESGFRFYVIFCSDSIGQKGKSGFSGRRFNLNHDCGATETLSEQFIPHEWSSENERLLAAIIVRAVLFLGNYRERSTGYDWHR